MNWTIPKPPTKGISFYDHVMCETPLGQFKIEWKGWKESPDYGVELDGKYVCTEYDLDDAKESAKTYLVEKHNELSKFLAD